MGARQSKRHCGRLPARHMMAHCYDDTDTSSICGPPRSAQCTGSICHFDVGPSQRCSDGNRRCRNRSRSFNICRRKSSNCCMRRSSNHSCCSCSLTPCASCCSRRCCYPTQEICAPTPRMQPVTCSTRTKQRCFNCPEYGCCRRAPRRECHRESYPVPNLPRNNHLYLHPLGARCEPLKPCPGQSTCQPVYKNCDDYYRCSPRKLRCKDSGCMPSGCKPSRCKPSGCTTSGCTPSGCTTSGCTPSVYTPSGCTTSGGTPSGYTTSGCTRGVAGKRMNVAIHTHVDYGCDADCTTRKKGCLKTKLCRKPSFCRKPPCQPCCPPGHPYGPSRCRQRSRRQCCESSESESRCGSDDSQCL